MDFRSFLTMQPDYQKIKLGLWGPLVSPFRNSVGCRVTKTVIIVHRDKPRRMRLVDWVAAHRLVMVFQLGS